MEMDVKPGMVLISLRKMRGAGFFFPPGGEPGRLHEEVDPGEAGAVAGAKGGQGHGADLFRAWAAVSFAGRMETLSSGPLSWYLAS